MHRRQLMTTITGMDSTKSSRALLKQFQGKAASSCKETRMLRLDLMSMNNGQEQWEALDWEKPMKEEKYF